jgi:hypothetical protein
MRARRRRRSRLGLIGAASDLDGSRKGEQLEPGQWVPGAPSLGDAPFGERSERPKRGGRMAGVHRLGCSTAEMELRRRIVPMAAWAGPTFRGDDALFLEVPHHAGRQADRFAGRSDAGQVVRFVGEWRSWHGVNLPRLCQIGINQYAASRSVCSTAE